MNSAGDRPGRTRRATGTSGEAAAAPGFQAVVRARARDWSRTAAPLHVFGGRPLLEAPLPASRVTSRPLHLTLDLDLSDERLAGLRLHGLERLAILANCHLDPSEEPIFVRHVDGGRRLELLDEPSGEPVPGVVDEFPQLPVDLEPRTEAIAACETFDDVPEPHGPLHQVGGAPVWVRHPIAAPLCPVSGRRMRFVACIDSDLRFPLGDRETPLLMGDCGALYVYWSDEAAVTAAIVQSP